MKKQPPAQWALVKIRPVYWVMLGLLLIGVAMFLHTVAELKAQIRMANYQATRDQVRAALLSDWVHRQVQHELQAQAQAKSASPKNPMRLLAVLPDNYVGELKNAPDTRDVWWFDTRHQQLQYVDMRGEIVVDAVAEKIQNRR